MNQKVGNRPDYGAFIPSQLDDYGLNPFEFRVFCHISRRAGTKEGEFFESDINASKICRMEIKTYRKAKHFLERSGMILIEQRPGKTAIVTLTHHENWALTKSGTTKSGTTKSGTATKSGTTPLPNQVPPNQAHKGTPILSEGIPFKGSPLNKEMNASEADAVVENFFLEEPSVSEIEALREATLETTGSEVNETELATLSKKKTSTSKAEQKQKGAAAPAEKPKFHPDAFEAWWGLFRRAAHGANCKPGSKAEAAIAWDLLHKIEPEPTLADLNDLIIRGTEHYWEREAFAQKPSCKHGCRFLTHRDWQDALDWYDSKATSNIQIEARYSPFLTCWNQDRPMTWPTADEGDLSPKSTGRLEELIASCANSLERFQKALHWAKRDPYWGLQRSQTLEEFLYSGRINEFYKKQIHAESIGMDKVVAPDRKAVEAASKMAASKRESLEMCRKWFLNGEMTKEEYRANLSSAGIDPDSVPEAC